MRGTSTSRICRLPASKTSLTMCRSSADRFWWPATRSRSSSLLIAPRPTFGSPPSSLTTRLTQTLISQTTGRASVAIRSSTGAATSEIRSERCSAIRLGASSPSTSEKNAITSVTQTNATHRGHMRRQRWSEHVLERVRQRRRAVRAGHQRRDRHADLDRGQEPVRVVGQPRRPLAALAALGQRPDLALAQRHQRHLGGGEEATDEDEGEDDKNVPADAIHVAVPDLGSQPRSATAGLIAAILAGIARSRDVRSV